MVIALAAAPMTGFAQSQAQKTGAGTTAGQAQQGGVAGTGLSTGAVVAGVAVAAAAAVAVAAATDDDDDDVVDTGGATTTLTGVAIP